MSFIIAGDTHGMIDINKIVKFFNEHEGKYTSEDYLIICGDVGICGFFASEEAETRRIFRNLPVTTLFVDGNHENFEQLNSYGIDIWNGGKVHFIEQVEGKSIPGKRPANVYRFNKEAYLEAKKNGIRIEFYC